MFGEDYAYAVARIRVLETGLLNQAAIEQLLACQDEQQCLQILTEKGWGNGDPAAGADAILSREREKIWALRGRQADSIPCKKDPEVPFPAVPCS